VQQIKKEERYPQWWPESSSEQPIIEINKGKGNNNIKQKHFEHYNNKEEVSKKELPKEVHIHLSKESIESKQTLRSPNK